MVARVVAYVDPSLTAEFARLCATRGEADGYVLNIQFATTDGDSRFHRDAIQEICASCDDLDKDGVEFRTVLGISRNRWRTSGPFGGRHAYFSRRLSRKSIEHACYPGVAPLSALDAGAISWIFNGNWEVDEATDRKHEIVARRRILESLGNRWRHDAARLESERSALLSSWLESQPERRTRRRRGWWSC